MVAIAEGHVWSSVLYTEAPAEALAVIGSSGSVTAVLAGLAEGKLNSS